MIWITILIRIHEECQTGRMPIRYYTHQNNAHQELCPSPIFQGWNFAYHFFTHPVLLKLNSVRNANKVALSTLSTVSSCLYGSLHECILLTAYCPLTNRFPIAYFFRNMLDYNQKGCFKELRVIYYKISSHTVFL